MPDPTASTSLVIPGVAWLWAAGATGIMSLVISMPILLHFS